VCACVFVYVLHGYLCYDVYMCCIHSAAGHCPKFQDVLQRKICRFLDSAGTKNQKLRGTNEFDLLFSKILRVQIICLFYSSLSGPKSTKHLQYLRTPTDCISKDE